MQAILSKKNNRYYYRSSSFKVAVLFAVMLLFAALSIGYSLYDFSMKNFLRETEKTINNEIENIVFNTFDYDKESRTKYLSIKSILKKYPLYYYSDVDGEFLAGNFRNPPFDDAFNLKEGVIGFEIYDKGQTINLAGKVHTFKDGSKILVAKNIDEQIKSYKKLRLYSIITFLFMMGVVLISFLLSTFVVSRIDKISNTAKSIISTGDLSKRIEIDSSWDDMSYLSSTLNGMLSRTESLMDGIKNVSNNIAHDLRTPITRLRNNIDSLNYKEVTQDEINHLASECDNIVSIFNSLLKINKVERGEKIDFSNIFNFNEVIEDVVDLYGPIAEDKNITIDCKIKGKHSLKGDKNLIFQLVANLLDNGIKFSENNSKISVNVYKRKRQTRLEIIDNGIGIEQEDIASIFDRFYRSQKSRSAPGNGLGLSLVKAITDIHSASIDIEKNNPGTKITVSFAP